MLKDNFLGIIGKKFEAINCLSKPGINAQSLWLFKYQRQPILFVGNQRKLNLLLDGIEGCSEVKGLKVYFADAEYEFQLKVIANISSRTVPNYMWLTSDNGMNFFVPNNLVDVEELLNKLEEIYENS